MKAKEEVMTLNDILNEFVAQYDRPTREALLVWIGRYPQYERELIEFVAAWAEQEIFPPARELSSEDEKKIVNRAMSHVQNVIYNQSENRKALRIKGTQFATLVDEGKNLGLSARELAEACDLDLALLTKLNNRQIEPKSIPSSVAARFAQVLKRPVELICSVFSAGTANNFGSLVPCPRQARGHGASEFLGSDPVVIFGSGSQGALAARDRQNRWWVGNRGRLRYHSFASPRSTQRGSGKSKWREHRNGAPSSRDRPNRNPTASCFAG